MAALLTAVGVEGAEVGCPEIDGGRTLTGRTRDGQHTHTHAQTHTHTHTEMEKPEKDRHIQSAPKQKKRQAKEAIEAAH